MSDLDNVSIVVYETPENENTNLAAKNSASSMSFQDWKAMREGKKPLDKEDVNDNNDNADRHDTEAGEDTGDSATLEEESDLLAGDTADGEEEDDEQEEEEEQEGDKGKRKKKGGYQRRVDKLTKRLSEKEQEIERLKTLVNTPIQSQGPLKVLKAPKPDDFDNYSNYVEALTDYKLEMKQREHAMKQEEELAKQEAEKMKKTFAERTENARKHYADFDDVKNNTTPVPQEAIQIILDSEVGPHITYYLHKNPEKAESIFKKPALLMAKEIGKIEDFIIKDLTKKQKEGKGPGISTKQNTHKPISTVSTSRTVPPKDPSKMSFQEFKAWRERK